MGGDTAMGPFPQGSDDVCEDSLVAAKRVSRQESPEQKDSYGRGWGVGGQPSPRERPSFISGLN